MVVCDQFEGSRWVAILLSSDGLPFGVDEPTSDPSETVKRTDALPEPAAASTRVT
jgi:hypothetical protein